MTKSRRSLNARIAPMRVRILAAWNAASADDLTAGLAWYQRAFDAACIIDPQNPRRAAAVIAALSPRCQWSTNVEWAAAVILHADTDRVCPIVHTAAMRATAWREALEYAPPGAHLRGPKVSAFYANIVGDTDAVTVDVWAIRAATGDPHHNGQISPAEYATIARAYREAAWLVMQSPRDVQAAVWVHTRGKAE